MIVPAGFLALVIAYFENCPNTKAVARDLLYTGQKVSGFHGLINFHSQINGFVNIAQQLFCICPSVSKKGQTDLVMLLTNPPVTKEVFRV